MGKKNLQYESDEYLLDLIRLNNDHAAFSMLYERYWNKLLAISFNLTNDKSVSKEIVQEIFISLWNRRNSLEIKNLNNYLATAVKFSFFDFIEKERRRRVLASAKFGEREEAELDLGIEALFMKEYLTSLLTSLPEKCRLIVTYSRIHDMSNSAIAEKLNISEKTVEGHLTKGLKLLRSNFKNRKSLAVLPILLYLHSL
ncbi:RNA polymerase sigma-70 factor [Chitinophaga sancti]|uniref:RNA polymerase sigma-70 factor n=1 Tax=Chitinophaga sancti TaxID=1004 RepID=UPI002A75A10A|nr:RNA polymerase sigma-70 factor [Chitinophaga sancti]WPQ66181.1 RNA polymerase sigma-70 factor [Chitinophaga sancti]